MPPSIALDDLAFDAKRKVMRDDFFAKHFLLDGYQRVYGRDNTLIVVYASEPPHGEPLYVRLV